MCPGLVTQGLGTPQEFLESAVTKKLWYLLEV